MVCEALNDITSFSDFLVWPTGCDYYFYLKLFLAIGLILAGILHRAQKKEEGKGDFISALGTSVIALNVLALTGTLVKNVSNIPMIQADILLFIIAISVPILLIWIFRGD